MAMRARPGPYYRVAAIDDHDIHLWTLRIGHCREHTTISGIVRLDYSRFNILLEYFTVKP